MSCARCSTPCARRGRGFTLAELTVALAVSSILVVGAGVVLTSTVRSVEVSAGAAAQQQSVRTALNQITADAGVATSIDTSVANQLSLTVPDRTGDAQSEVIRYTWSGTRGASLLRSFNGVVSKVANDVQTVSFSTTVRPGPIYSTLTNQTLAEPGVSPTGQKADFKTGRKVGVCIRPTLPASAIKWSASAVEWCMSKDSGGESIVFELRDATSAGVPGSVVLARSVESSTALSASRGWHRVSLAANDLTPTTPITAVVYMQAGSDEETTQLYHTSGQAPPGNMAVWEIDSTNPTWTAPVSPKLIHVRLIGSYVTKAEQ